MFKDAKAANMAAYLLFKAGAEGLPRRRLLALMYLSERDRIRRRGVPAAYDEYMLTGDGPVMTGTYGRIMEGLEDSPGAHHEWERLAEAEGGTVVREAEVAYAARPSAALALAHLVLRSPQPPPRWDDGKPMAPLAADWPGKEEGVPYLGDLSVADRMQLDDTWREHGRRDEEDLIQHMLELPECRAGKRTGSRTITFSAILRAVGYTAREIKESLEHAKMVASIQRLAESRG